jgi:hypothetical protein
MRKIVQEKTTAQNSAKVLQALESFIIKGDDGLSIGEATIQEALSGEGEFVIVESNYDEFETQGYKQWLKEKLSEAINIVVVFEDDGNQFGTIEKIAAFIYENTTSMQKVQIGVKKVKQLSATPLRVLFAEIYPINQLEMFLGDEVFDFIEQHKEYFLPYFQKLRFIISREIGVALLPLLPKKSQNLSPKEVCLTDKLTHKKIVEFQVKKLETTQDLDSYLQQLLKIFLQLGKRYKH